MKKEHQTYIMNKYPDIAFINEPMKKHSSFGIGGYAKVFLLPNDKKEIKKILQYAAKNKIKVFFTGSGSNLLVSDDGFNGIIVSLKKTFKKLQIFDDGAIIAESGVMLGSMVRQAISKNIKGLESLVGVPGTLGGALYMNAGAYGTEISKYFVSAKLFDIEGNEKVFTNKDIQFFYRKSTFPNNYLLIEMEFKCQKGEIKDIMENKAKFSQSRKDKQPLKYRSAGSIFKNPSLDIAAGYLIDKAGLKGVRKGGAEISKKHANFIINLGKASSDDVIYLIKLIKEKITQKFNINLELEIKLLGFKEKLLKEISNYA